MSTPALGDIRLTDCAPTVADFRREFIEGLDRRPRRLPCKFFYDAEGSRLFDRICETPEYYPTRTERRLLSDQGGNIARFCGPRCRLVELGSGSSLKTRRLLEALHDPAGYVPVDISRRHLLASAQALAAEYPALEILPVCADYGQSIELPTTTRAAEQTVVFFPGSTIGNFEPAEATAFLAQVGRWCATGDRMIIGVDLVKPVDVIERAYNDAAGVTAAFNLNLLARANRELSADFDLSRFAHQAVYDWKWERIEMRLVSTCEQVVSVAGRRMAFAAGEILITEYSHKFGRESFRQLARAAGWIPREFWTDDRGWFGIFALERVGV